MAKKPDAVRTQFRIPPALNEKIDEYADAHNLSKNQAMVLLIEKGFERVGKNSQKLEEFAGSEIIAILAKEVALHLQRNERSKSDDS